MTRLVPAAAALLLALAGASAPALADWRYDRSDWHRGRPDWRYDEEWRWHHRPPHYRPGPREVMMVFPPPPPRYVPGPRVVYVEPPPVQAVPMSPPFTDSYGRYCREYQTTVVVGGMAQPGYGTACLMPDGQWRVVR